MPILFFDTIQQVLGEGLSSVCRSLRIDESEALERARDYLTRNSAAYFEAEGRVEYENPLCRLAYLYCYVAAHANLVDNSFYRFPELREFFLEKARSSREIGVCALGGGPGSELLGIVKFFDRDREPTDFIDIEFALLDKVFEWDETWNALGRGLEASFRDVFGPSRREWPVVVHRSFIPADLTDVAKFSCFVDRFSRTHLFILNHTMSEFLDCSGFSDVFQHLVSVAQDNAMFLIIDRQQTQVQEFSGGMTRAAGLHEIATKREDSNMDSDEQASDLGKWVSDMGRPPKLTWRVFYALYRKSS